jgi:HD-GYP domain-containing protein (c-di-GMP phosphodiesterase class II)
MQGFPDQFDLRDDPVFQERIRPFIESELEKLKEFDAQRAAWARENLPKKYEMTYIFHQHAQRVAEDMRQAALHLGLAPPVAENLYWAMLPHDIGKRLLPVGLWDMVEKPDDKVKALRRSHTERGVALVDEAFSGLDHPFLGLMRDIMLNHHEQMDGRGFRGIDASGLTPPVRLACIVESYDGYGIFRPHFGKRDITPEGVLNRMRREKGPQHYDMDLFEAFAEMKTAQGKKPKKEAY